MRRREQLASYRMHSLRALPSNKNRSHRYNLRRRFQELIQRADWQTTDSSDPPRRNVCLGRMGERSLKYAAHSVGVEPLVRPGTGFTDRGVPPVAIDAARPMAATKVGVQASAWRSEPQPDAFSLKAELQQQMRIPHLTTARKFRSRVVRNAWTRGAFDGPSRSDQPLNPTMILYSAKRMQPAPATIRMIAMIRASAPFISLPRLL